MPRKPHYVLLSVVGLAALILLALPEGTRSRLRLAFGSLFLPLFGLAGSTQSLAERVSSMATPRSSLVARIRQLEEERDRLSLRLVETEAAARENDRLRQMVGYAPRTNWRLKPGQVIGRDPSGWWQTVLVDLGTEDGLTNNLAVLAPEGLVGRVVEVGSRTSRVVLVGDPNCPVAVALADSRETGIIRGASGSEFQGGVVNLSYLPRSAVVKPGQRVFTSGQGGVYPAGIPVGVVVDVRPGEADIYLEARVRLAAGLGALQHVWVKLP